MKTEIWLDTTALVDLEFRSDVLRQHILQGLPSDSERHATHYVLFEFARGVLRRYLRLHNKAAELDNLSELVHYIKNCNVGSQRTASTMLGAYQDFLEYLQKDDKALSPGQQMEHFRAWLAPHIRRGWRRVKQYITHNPIGCRDDLPAPRTIPLPKTFPVREQIAQDLPDRKCGQPDNCRLVATIQANSEAFRGMHAALTALDQPDAETSARTTALERFLNHIVTEPFDSKDCYRCGDAIIASEVPEGIRLLSKNIRHLQPLCGAVSRPLMHYREPAPGTRVQA
ncbi:MAG: hypothetical protein JNG86_08120 [Verrucomicrobiaceae bacterium]|nr:hypothetical protein [Verrucomicrobiaceae bacterium]